MIRSCKQATDTSLIPSLDLLDNLSQLLQIHKDDPEWTQDTITDIENERNVPNVTENLFLLSVSKHSADQKQK